MLISFKNFFYSHKRVTVSLILSLIISIIPFLLQAGTALFHYDPLERWENYFFDIFLINRNSGGEKGKVKYYDDIIILTINEKTFKTLGRMQDWKRSVYTDLFNKLIKGNAQLIFTDILLTDPSPDKNADTELANLYMKDDRIFLPLNYYRNSDYSFTLSYPLEFILKERVKEEELKGLYEKRAGMVALGDIREGTVRSVPLLYQYKEENLYNIQLLLWLKEKGLKTEDIRAEKNRLRIKNLLIPLEGKGEFVINYRVLPLSLSREKGDKEITSYSEKFPLCQTAGLEEIMEIPHGEEGEEILKDIFAGKTVFVGTVDPASGDIKNTPLGAMPGIFINVCLFTNLLDGDFIRFTPWQVNWIITFLLCLISTLLLLWLHPTLGGIGSIFMGMAYTFYAYILFSHHSVMVSVALPHGGLILNIMVVSIYLYRLMTAQRQRIRKIFGEYLSPTVVDTLIKEEAEGKLGLEGKKEVVTVFYSDIRGFTNLSEKLTPEEVVSLLNEYFDVMAGIVISYGGYIDKYIGDCLMAIFSAPIPKEDDAKRAVLSALDQQQAIKELQQKWEKEGKKTFSVGMGINTGEVVLGNIGSPRKKDYTVIGDNVNLAARLYDKAKGGQILISKATYHRVKDIVECRFVDTMKVKGKEEAVEVYEILAKK